MNAAARLFDALSNDEEIGVEALDRVGNKKVVSNVSVSDKGATIGC